MLDAAAAAVNATARGKLAELEQELERLVRQAQQIEKDFTVGAARVTRWSMSSTAAQRGVQEARRFQPLNEVVVTSQIEILERKPAKSR